MWEKPKMWVEYKYDEPGFVITVVWLRGLRHMDGYHDGWWSAALVRIQVPSYFSFNSQLTSYRSTTSNINTKRSSHWKNNLSFIIYLWYPYILIVSWPLFQRYISMIAGNQRLKNDNYISDLKDICMVNFLIVPISWRRIITVQVCGE